MAKYYVLYEPFDVPPPEVLFISPWVEAETGAEALEIMKARYTTIVAAATKVLRPKPLNRTCIPCRYQVYSGALYLRRLTKRFQQKGI